MTVQKDRIIITTNDERLNDERRTTNDERRTTNGDDKTTCSSEQSHHGFDSVRLNGVVWSVRQLVGDVATVSVGCWLW